MIIKYSKAQKAKFVEGFNAMVDHRKNGLLGDPKARASSAFYYGREAARNFMQEMQLRQMQGEAVDITHVNYHITVDQVDEVQQKVEANLQAIMDRKYGK